MQVSQQASPPTLTILIQVLAILSICCVVHPSAQASEGNFQLNTPEPLTVRMGVPGRRSGGGTRMIAATEPPIPGTPGGGR